MKHIKLFESFEDIHDICKKYNITNYTINDDGSIDVDGNVNLQYRELTKLPLKFRNVNGRFHCHMNFLTSLEGCPNKVGGDFACSSNLLESLEGCPEYIEGDFIFRNNKIYSFEGFPKHIGGGISGENNPIYEIYCFFDDYSKIELFNDMDIIQNKVVILDRLNFFLEEIDKETYDGEGPVIFVDGYKCV